MNSKYRDEYIGRINRVIDYIQNHLEEQLDLESLARVAHFSKFHFHRIFTAMVGETLNSFIKRLRIEKAATQLIAYPKSSITEIALNCGFSGSSQFSRSFNEYFGMSASAYRQSGLKNSKNSKTESKDRKAVGQIPPYFDGANSKQKRGIKMKVEVKKLDDTTVAYLRHIGPYQGNSELFENLFTKLFKWAGPRDLLNFPETGMMSIYYDDPNLTEDSKLRLDVCITIPEDTEVDGEIGKMVVAGGKYAVGSFEINPDEYAAAWEKLMGEWLPDSGFVPDDKPCFEMYMNDPKEHPEGKHLVDIYVPVKPI